MNVGLILGGTFCLIAGLVRGIMIRRSRDYIISQQHYYYNVIRFDGDEYLFPDRQVLWHLLCHGQLHSHAGAVPYSSAQSDARLGHYGGKDWDRRIAIYRCLGM